jgi:uncharacterized protein YegL
MPNANLTHIAFVLDRSGSMGAIREQAISGFNSFLQAQGQLEGEARFTLVLFNGEVQRTCHNIPVTEMTPLDWQSFVPDGNTALDDAVGSTIDQLGSELTALPEEQRPGKVVIAVLTDGEENASQRYTTADVKQRVEHQREQYGWEFVFLGASPETFAQAAARGNLAEDTLKFDANPEGMSLCMSEACEMVSVRRQRPSRRTKGQEGREGARGDVVR